jgi:hypothetical protein
VGVEFHESARRRPNSVESGATSNTARKSRPIDAAGGIGVQGSVVSIAHVMK